MLDQQDRQPTLLQRADDTEHLGSLGFVHPRRRLIEQQQSRVQRKGASDLQPAAIGIGQAERRMIETRQQPIAEQAEDVAQFGIKCCLLPRDSRWLHQGKRQLDQWPNNGRRTTNHIQSRMRTDQHVVAHTEIGEHAPMLEGTGQPERGDTIRRHAGNVAAGKHNAAGVRGIVAGNEVEQRRLAGTVRADDRHQFTGIERQIELLHRDNAAKPSHHAQHLEQWRHTVPSMPCGRKRISSNSTTP